MIDRIFAPVLTFVMLVAGTAAIASSLFGPARNADLQVAQGMPTSAYVLETVVITAQRAPADPKLACTEKDAPATTRQPSEARGRALGSSKV